MTVTNKNFVLKKQSMNNTIIFYITNKILCSLELSSITMVESNKIKALKKHGRQVNERIRVLY
jgi:hypothetical protein